MTMMNKLSKMSQVHHQTERAFESGNRYFCWWVLFSSCQLKSNFVFNKVNL